MALSWSSWGWLSSVSAKETFQPTEKAGFFGFGDGGSGLRLERALLTALFAELLTTFTRLLATRFAGTKLVAWFLRLFAAGGAIIVARRTVGIASLTIFMTLRTEIRAAFAARISVGGWLFRLAADLPALGWASFSFWRKDFELGFGFDDSFGGDRFDFDRSRRSHGSDDGDWGGGSGLLCGDGCGGLLDVGWRFDDRCRSGLGRERIFVLALVVNDLNGGRLIAAGGGFFAGGWGGRAGAFAARQA